MWLISYLVYDRIIFFQFVIDNLTVKNSLFHKGCGLWITLPKIYSENMCVVRAAPFLFSVNCMWMAPIITRCYSVFLVPLWLKNYLLFRIWYAAWDSIHFLCQTKLRNKSLKLKNEMKMSLIDLMDREQEILIFWCLFSKFLSLTNVSHFHRLCF